MKKTIVYIMIAFLLAITVVGVTYAYYGVIINPKEDSLTTNAHKFEVIYTGGTDIGGELELVNTKEEGKNTTVNIKIAEGSVEALANIYIHIDQMTDNLASNALRWEVYRNNEEQNIKAGNFMYCVSGNIKKKCESGDKLYLINDYKLTTDDTSFTVYIWLDGNLATNDILGGFFQGYIGAETETFTGNLG
ncbi:MAG: hypothetical protein IJE89_00620 [Bacilli bacterium]|nr:hypothetical protein [Bacilli bacterium]